MTQSAMSWPSYPACYSLLVSCLRSTCRLTAAKYLRYFELLCSFWSDCPSFKLPCWHCMQTSDFWKEVVREQLAKKKIIINHIFPQFLLTTFSEHICLSNSFIFHTTFPISFSLSQDIIPVHSWSPSSRNSFLPILLSHLQINVTFAGWSVLKSFLNTSVRGVFLKENTLYKVNHLLAYRSGTSYEDHRGSSA